MPADRDDVEAYWLIRRAVRDGIWDVIGTILTVVIVVVLLLVGVASIAQGLAAVGPVGLLVAAFGVVLVAGAVVTFLREFRLYPFD